MIQPILLLLCFLMTVPTTFADGHLNHSAPLKSKEAAFKRADAEYKAAYARAQEAKTKLSKAVATSDRAWSAYRRPFEDWLDIEDKDSQEAKLLKAKYKVAKHRYDLTSESYKTAKDWVQEVQSSLDTTLHNLNKANNELKRALFHSMTESIGSKISETN